ncbi:MULTISPECIES: hypothetical protein [Acinetobacter]|uniref:hypothetical protein n=1 Tax=Acinetobacter TaxID=469 RepID=UPI000693CC14|nr:MULTISPECIES: hypothetical protein [Acinetobacter]AWA48675.1 hypothetical protein CDG57_12225 [Acinetobacter junii]MDH1005954.1 hypothetical protein [Acinetobacter junii]MDI6621428.1 hypothetical protein [Acinetobacter junii]QXR29324.1 hypothetical protein EGT69_012465 [Acinetobacter junii]
MTILHTVSFQRTVLATMVGLCLSQSVFAFESLEQLDDSALSQATGEGIALLPENFSMVLQGANDDPATWAAAPGDRTQDTGYIRAIPVGPLTPEAQAAGAGKADLYLYGLGISQSKRAYGAARDATDYGTRFNPNNPITSWGSAENPWLLKVTTENNVPNFSATSPKDTGNGAVSYLTLETPLYHKDTDSDFLNGNQGIANLSPALQSAYNLKLGLWADAFVRDPKVMENLTATGTQFDLGGAGRANRMRAQVIWDGLGINGTNLKFFQTLGGAVNGGTYNAQNLKDAASPIPTNFGLSTSYNHTLGVAGVIRLNSGDAQNLAATYTAATRYYGGTTARTNGVVVGAYTGGGDTTYALTDNQGYGAVTTGGGCDLGFQVEVCEYRFRSRNVTDVIGNWTWTAPAVSSVMRLSTKETTNTALLGTPAINGGAAPTFDSTEGLYLYNPNINLVLGSLYQPLTFGVAPDGKNLVIELARIPNKESIYKKIYTNYDNSNVATNGGYTGSTCNIYQCGTNSTTEYQGNNATHSSITIGSTLYDSATNSLSARKDNGAVGVSFGPLGNNSGSASYRGYTQYQDQQRRTRERNYNWTDTYEVYDVDRDFCGNNALQINCYSRTFDPYLGTRNCNPSGGAGYNTCARTLQLGYGTDAYGTTITASVAVDANGLNWIRSTQCSSSTLGVCTGTSTTNVGPVQTVKGSHLDWEYRTGGNADIGTGWNAGNTYDDTTGTNGIRYNLNASADLRDSGGRNVKTENLSWTQAGPNWSPATAKSLAVVGQPLDNIQSNPTNSFTMSPLNNFGSVAIDGLLINHMKITTKGL